MPAGKLHLEAGALRPAVARHDRLGEGRRRPAPSSAQAARTPARAPARAAARVPITPVEATPTWSGSMPSSLGRGGLLRACAVSSPRWPSPTFERAGVGGHRAQPAEAAPARDTITGAPTRALVVKRAAETVLGLVGRRARPRRAPRGLRPAATPAARKPAGQQRWARARSRAPGARPSASGRSRSTRAAPPVSGRPSIRFRSCTAWPAAPFQRLSIAANAIVRRRTTVTWTPAAVVSCTSRVCGGASTTSTNGSLGVGLSSRCGRPPPSVSRGTVR